MQCIIVILPLKWSDGPIKVLGIHIGNDSSDIAQLNYEELVNKAANICDLWSCRSLTILGKILVINTLVLPLFVYRLQVWASPSVHIVKRYKKVITELPLG